MDFISNDINYEGTVKIRIDAVGGDLDRVACKYPVSFMNEMARQLTVAIEAATGVEGLADSSVKLVMMFASGTYMEHISGNVTYRRLALIDAVSAPRDFWVKWTRLDAVEGEYNEENILFELGEDVEQKIREKEYRYLLTAGKDKYHNSMGRKKVTEWREVIKRAARRGELTKLESDFELAPETLELEERIADLLGKRIESRNQPKEETIVAAPENDEFARAMEKARMVVEEASRDTDDDIIEVVEEPVAEEVVVEEIAEEEEILEIEDEPVELETDEPEIEIEIVEEAPVEIDEPEIEIEIVEETFVDETADAAAAEEFDIFADTEADASKDEADAFDEGDGAELLLTEELVEENVEELESEPEIEIEIVEILEPAVEEEQAEPEIEIEIVEAPAVDVVAEPAPVAEPVAVETDIADRVAGIRAEIETKIRLEYESRARMKAEQELIELRREQQRLKAETDALLAEARKEQERLRLEYELLIEQTSRAEAMREAEENRRRMEEAALRAEIEAQLRAEASERERLAEAARMAIEEQHRLEAENARIARQREEEEREEAERVRKIEEERAIEAARQAEMERIRREHEEAQEKARNAMPVMGDGRYAYTSKTVKFLFRRSVDPNITSRIQEIIKATVDYYGKDNVYLKIRATVPDSQTVVLEFAQIPLEEMELLGNIIKILGNSGLGIAKAIID